MNERSLWVALRVELPATPRLWSDLWGDATYTVTWSFFMGGGSIAGVPAEGVAEFQAPRGELVAICAWPVIDAAPTSGGDRLRPAGTIVHVTRPTAVSVTFQSGFEAWILSEAADRGADIRSFNRQRMHSVILNHELEDPWRLDGERIVRAICEGAMRESYIRDRERHKVELRLPEGIWVSRSPFAQPVEGGDRELHLPAGVTVLFDRTRRLVIDVDARGRAWWSVTSPRS